MQFKHALGIVALLGAPICATPIDIVGDVECLVVTVVIQVLAALTSETEFCLSYLNLPTITNTVKSISTVFTTTTKPTTTGTNIITAGAVTVIETEYVMIAPTSRKLTTNSEQIRDGYHMRPQYSQQAPTVDYVSKQHICKHNCAFLPNQH